MNNGKSEHSPEDLFVRSSVWEGHAFNLTIRGLAKFQEVIHIRRRIRFECSMLNFQCSSFWELLVEHLSQKLNCASWEVGTLND